jgi:ribonucleoside-diphosphate reductase beta chain
VQDAGTRLARCSALVAYFVAAPSIRYRQFLLAVIPFSDRLLPGLCFSNELVISRDESLHCDFACLLHNRLVFPTNPCHISTIIRDAVSIEHELVRDAIPVRLLGTNAGLMWQYIELCVDRPMVALEQPRIYGVNNPFPWMTLISLAGKSQLLRKMCR